MKAWTWRLCEQQGSRPPLAFDGWTTTANSSSQDIRVHGIAGGITNHGSKGRWDHPISTISMEGSDFPLRERVVRLFLSLPLAERLRLLTFEDPSWCALAANMAARLERRSAVEQEVRFDVQPPPVGVSGGRATFQATVIEMELKNPSNITQARISRPATALATSSLENAAIAYGDPPKAVTFSECFLGDHHHFFRVMDEASHGGFLREQRSDHRSTRSSVDYCCSSKEACSRSKQQSHSLAPTEVLTTPAGRSGKSAQWNPQSGVNLELAEKRTHGEDWFQTPWLRGMGSFTLAAFLANRIEARLRAALATHRNIQGQMEIEEVTTAVAGSAGNAGLFAGGNRSRGSGGRKGAPGKTAVVTEELLDAKRSLGVFLERLGEEERRHALVSCAAESVCTLLRGQRDLVEVGMYKSGHLGGRPPGVVHPSNRFDDMDWVRGRPPSALLFLKALLKGTTQSLSLNTNRSNYKEKILLERRRTSTAGIVPAFGPNLEIDPASVACDNLATTAISSSAHDRPEGDIRFSSESCGVGEPHTAASKRDERGAIVSISATPGHGCINISEKAKRGAIVTVPTIPATGYPAGYLGNPADPPAETKPKEFDMDICPKTASAESTAMPARHVFIKKGPKQCRAAVNARRLAEEALLSPLGEVGTIAGMLRSRLGNSLREKAAARAAKDLTDLISQEKVSAAAEKDARGIADRAATNASGSSSAAKARAKKKRLRKKKNSDLVAGIVGANCSNVEGSAGGTGDMVPKTQAVDHAPASTSFSPLEATVVQGNGSCSLQNQGDKYLGDHAAFGDDYSTGSSETDRLPSRRNVGRHTGSENGPSGCKGDVGSKEAEDESYDDEEEQMGVVKKLRWRTEVGLMGPKASPPGKGVAKFPTGARATGSGGDGFVSPLDIRRRAKARSSVHFLVMEIVEQALAECMPCISPKRTYIATSPDQAPNSRRMVSTARSASARAASSRPAPTRMVSASVPATCITPTPGAPAKVAALPAKISVVSAQKDTANTSMSSQERVNKTDIPSCPPCPLLWPSPAESFSPVASSGHLTSAWQAPPVSVASTIPVTAPCTGLEMKAKMVMSPLTTFAATTASTALKQIIVAPSKPPEKNSPSARRRRRPVGGGNGNTAGGIFSRQRQGGRQEIVDFVDIPRPSKGRASLPISARGPSKSPSSSSSPRSAAHRQRSAPGYFPSRSPAFLSSTSQPPTSPVVASFTAFYNHGMTLDWRACGGCDGGERRDAPKAKVPAVNGGSKSGEFGSAGSPGSEGSKGGDGDDGAKGRGEVGFVIPHVGRGSSFFGEQGLFLWTPSSEGALPGSTERGGAWGIASGDRTNTALVNPVVKACGSDAERSGAIGSWESMAPEQAVSPELEVPVPERTGNHSGNESDHEVKHANKEICKETRNDTETSDDSSKTRETREKPPASDEGTQLGRNRVPGVKFGVSTPLRETREAHGAAQSDFVLGMEHETDEVDESVIVANEVSGDVLDPKSSHAETTFCDSGTPDVGSTDPPVEAKVAPRYVEGENVLHDVQTVDMLQAPGKVKPAIITISHAVPEVDDPQSLPQAETNKTTIAARASSVIIANKEDSSNAQVANDVNEGSSTVAALVEGSASMRQSGASGTTTSKPTRCCLCACHDSHPLRLPPTPPPGRSSRLSRRQQRRRASAPERRIPSPSAGGRGERAKIGGDIEKENGVDVLEQSVMTNVEHASENVKPRAPDRHLFVRHLSEDSRGSLAHQQSSIPITPHIMATVTGIGGVAFGGGGGSATSPEDRSDYSVRTPPRSGRRHPRSGADNGSSGRGRGRGASSSVPVHRLSAARRRKSESGLGMMGVAATHSGDACTGAAGSKFRGRRAESLTCGKSSSVVQETTPVQTASRMSHTVVTGTMSKGKLGTPPAWSWKSLKNEPHIDGSRVRSDSDACAPSSSGDRDDVGIASAGSENTYHAKNQSSAWSAQGEMPLAKGKASPYVFRSRGGSWDSDPRDGSEFRAGRELNGQKNSFRSAPRGGCEGRMPAEGARSMSDICRRRDDGIQRRAGAGLERWSSEDEGCDASLSGMADDPTGEDGRGWLKVHPAEDVTSVAGLAPSVGDGPEESFASDGGVAGMAVGETGSLDTSGSGGGFPERGFHESGSLEGGIGRVIAGGYRRDSQDAQLDDLVRGRDANPGVVKSQERRDVRDCEGTGQHHHHYPWGEDMPSGIMDDDAASACSADDRELDDIPEASRNHHVEDIGRGDNHFTEVEEDNLLMRDMCLRLEAEIAKLRNVLACERGLVSSTGNIARPPGSTAAGGGGGGGGGGGANGVRRGTGDGGFLPRFARSAGAGGRDVLPGMSHMVIPEHRTAAWEVMSDDGQGLAVWQHQALFDPSWPTGSSGGRTGVTRGDNAYNGFRPIAPVFVPEQKHDQGQGQGQRLHQREQGPQHVQDQESEQGQAKSRGQQEHGERFIREQDRDHGRKKQQGHEKGHEADERRSQGQGHRHRQGSDEQERQREQHRQRNRDQGQRQRGIEGDRKQGAKEVGKGGNSGYSSGMGGGGVSGETGSAQTGSCLGGMGAGGGGGGLGAVLWDDDYRALRARLEVPSLGFGSLRTPGQDAGYSKRGKGGGQGGLSLRSRLCEDLSRFLHLVTERERRTFDAKWMVYLRCRAVVRGLWPRAQVKPYGSFVTGLSLPWSDLDLVICLPKVRRDAPADTPGALEGRNAIKETWQQELARSLGGERWVDSNSLKIISHTAVPVIKLTTQGCIPGPILPAPVANCSGHGVSCSGTGGVACRGRTSYATNEVARGSPILHHDSRHHGQNHHIRQMSSSLPATPTVPPLAPGRLTPPPSPIRPPAGMFDTFSGSGSSIVSRHTPIYGETAIEHRLPPPSPAKGVGSSDGVGRESREASFDATADSTRVRNSNMTSDGISKEVSSIESNSGTRNGASNEGCHTVNLGDPKSQATFKTDREDDRRQEEQSEPLARCNQHHYDETAQSRTSVDGADMDAPTKSDKGEGISRLHCIGPQASNGEDDVSRSGMGASGDVNDRPSLSTDPVQHEGQKGGNRKQVKREKDRDHRLSDDDHEKQQATHDHHAQCEEPKRKPLEVTHRSGTEGASTTTREQVLVSDREPSRGGACSANGGSGAGSTSPNAGIEGGIYPRVLVDVSFEGQGHNGQAANQLVKDLVDGFPALRPLALLLKQFMMEKGLCVSYTGGLSSYALTLMVARYLQEQTCQMDSGSLLLGFLDFYGNHFDPRTTGVSVGRSRYFSRSAPLAPPSGHSPVSRLPGAPGAAPIYYGQRGRHPAFQGGLGRAAPPRGPTVTTIPGWSDMMRMPYRFDPLFIEDPMNVSNNVGRNCFRIYQIQRAWSDAHASLTRALDDESQLGQGSYRLLRCIISDPETVAENMSD